MIASAGALLMMGGFLNGVDPRFRTLSTFMKHVIGQASAVSPTLVYPENVLASSSSCTFQEEAFRVQASWLGLSLTYLPTFQNIRPCQEWLDGRGVACAAKRFDPSQRAANSRLQLCW